MKIGKHRILLIVMSCFLFSMVLTGCDYKHTAVVDIRNNKEGEIGRRSVYWSGVSKNDLTIKDDKSRDITFTINMKKGSLELTVKNSEGEEVYTLSREGEYSDAITFTAAESGTYTITQKGEKFSGSYTVTWGSGGEEETAQESTEEII